MPKISVCIITKNAMPRFLDTLESVKWADEIVVLDSGSSDGTVELAKQYTNNVQITDWPGFGVQSQRAIEACTGDWIVRIDSDEVITESLRQEILENIRTVSTKVNAFQMPILTYFCDQPIRHCGWYPKRKARVFRNGFVSYSTNYVHEEALIEGEVLTLKNDLLHYSYDSIDRLIEKTNFYTTLGAKDLANRGEKSTIVGALGRGIWGFFRLLILKRGFLDGSYGLVICLNFGISTFYKYCKLATLNKTSSTNK